MRFIHILIFISFATVSSCQSKGPGACPQGEDEEVMAYQRIKQLDQEIAKRVEVFDLEPNVDLSSDSNYQRLQELRYLRDQSVDILARFKEKNSQCHFSLPHFSNEELNKELNQLEEQP